MKSKMKVAVVQIDSTDNIENNKNKIEQMIKSVSSKADLVILPEHADGIGKKEVDFACTIPGPLTDFYSKLAIENNLYLHCGSIVNKTNTNKPYNTSLLFSPDGEIIAKYSKTHLFDVDLPDGTGCKESDEITQGSEIVSIELPIGKLGFAICYDIRFPDLFRVMAEDGCDVICVCANFTAQTGEYHWEPILKSRAIENGCYIIAANQCGTKPLFKSFGHSMVIDPWGRVVSSLDENEGIILCELDLSLVDEIRDKIPSLKNRRKDLY